MQLRQDTAGDAHKLWDDSRAHKECCKHVSLLHSKPVQALQARPLETTVANGEKNSRRWKIMYDDDYSTHLKLLSRTCNYHSTVPVCIPSATASEFFLLPNTMHQDTNGSRILTTTITSTQLSSMLAKVGSVGRTLLFCMLLHPNSSRTEHRCPPFPPLRCQRGQPALPKKRKG